MTTLQRINVLNCYSGLILIHITYKISLINSSFYPYLINKLQVCCPFAGIYVMWNIINAACDCDIWHGTSAFLLDLFFKCQHFIHMSYVEKNM